MYPSASTVCSVCTFFFFSSRRRHTRYWRDWSSDVCSSDLATAGSGGLLELGPTMVRRLSRPVERAEAAGTDEARLAAYAELRALLSWLSVRSEERRGGEECRSRWTPYHYKKKQQNV